MTLSKIQTEREDINPKGEQKDIRKTIKLLKNRISARKCRQKKREYYDHLQSKVANLEIELENYKILNQQKNSVNCLIEKVIRFITQLESLEKEIAITDKSKALNKKIEYKTKQNKILFELYCNIVKVIMPIEYKVFATKFIKFNEISSSETTNQIIEKIIQNQEM